MLQSRKIRYHSAEPNKNAVRNSALRRDKIRQKREYLIKVGKLIEDQGRRGKRR
ncbi:hypothetical protein KKG19_03760 [Patescibacteria group bacterium]|nr:hypothetical protein [Patescibacteria group bacterium]